MISAHVAWLLCLLLQSTTASPGPPTEQSEADVSASPKDLPEQEPLLAPTDPAASAQEEVHEAELRRLEQEIGSPNPDSIGEEQSASYRFYGFADAGLQKFMPRRHSATNFVVRSDAPYFALGNLNLYLDAQVSREWSTFFEVRLTTLPHGITPVCAVTAECPIQNLEVYNPTNPAPLERVRLSMMVLERAYVQWRHSDALILRTGFFLTPFGIWNIDHGSPTLISLMLPNFELNEFFPIQQVGVEALGTFHLPAWELDYFLYASNGRGYRPFDVDTEKMIGGRLVLRRLVPWSLALGVSGLTGRFVERGRKVIPPFTIERPELIAYREVVGGADLSLDISRLRIRTELAMRYPKYERGKRDLFFGNPGLYVPDRLEWSAYALVAYQLPWLGLEPYVYLEVYRFPTPISEGAVSPSVGFNIHFTSFVQLKTQYLYTWLASLDDPTGREQTQHNYQLIATRLVLAF